MLAFSPTPGKSMPVIRLSALVFAGVLRAPSIIAPTNRRPHDGRQAGAPQKSSRLTPMDSAPPDCAAGHERDLRRPLTPGRL